MSIITNGAKNQTGTKFYVPLKWTDKIDVNALLEYMIHLKMNQNNIKNFNNLEKEACSVQDQRVPTIREIIEERVKMVDWIMKICKKYNLKNETFFKAVNILDNFLAKTEKRIMSLEEIQFNCVICLSIACKFEEVNCNYLIFFRENLLDKNVYEMKDLINKEMEILKTLNFKLDMPYFYLFNNTIMQVAISNFYKDSNETQDSANIQVLCTELIKHNDFITKKFSLLKESIFSSALNSGIVCFKMTLLSMKFNGNLNTSRINELIDSSFLSLILKPEYLQRCDIVASNIFKYLAMQGMEASKPVNSADIPNEE